MAACGAKPIDSQLEVFDILDVYHHSPPYDGGIVVAVLYWRDVHHFQFYFTNNLIFVL